MNDEENRLRTFSSWPSSAPVEPSRIAKAGFFHTGNDLEVECFACGNKISEWNYGDQVMARHRRLAPQCPFVINPASNSNQPTSSTNTNVLTYRSERARVQSFRNWPLSDVISAESLSKAGFYSLQNGDKVKCAFCQGICGFWERGDDPKTEHKRHFPSCPFVRADFKDSKNGSTNSLDGGGGGVLQMENLGIINSNRGPKQPRFATVESRLRSFTNWNVDLIQTPEMLSEAGFYFVGTGDQVRCFYCDGGLRHWDPDDVPWSEHAKWFPTCAFVNLIKGQDFILACTGERERQGDIDEQDGLQRERPRPHHERRHSDTSERRTVEEVPRRPSSTTLTVHEKRNRSVSPKVNLEVNLKEENRQLKEAMKEARLCKVCMDNEMGVVFLPCGHLSTCISCAPSLKTCPVCRAIIQGTVRTFMS